MTFAALLLDPDDAIDLQAGAGRCRVRPGASILDRTLQRLPFGALSDP